MMMIVDHVALYWDFRFDFTPSKMYVRITYYVLSIIWLYLISFSTLLLEESVLESILEKGRWYEMDFNGVLLWRSSTYMV